jgi:glycosyltransferase involved in cell wall biosynthesis
MRVLVFSTQHLETGGIESHLKEFCLHLHKSGVDIDLLVTSAAMSAETEAYYQGLCSHVFLCKAKKSTFRFLWLYAVLFRLKFATYNAVYTNGQGESIWFLSRLLSRKSWWVHHHHTAGDAADQSYWGPRYWRALRAADRLIACSTTNAHTMSQALNRRVDTVPCFSRAVKPVLPTDRQARRIRLGYYGRLIPEKGIDLLCRLSDDAELSDVEFHVWGEGNAYPPAFFDQYPNVAFHGAFAGTEKLTGVLNSLDALLLLTTNAEGLPISLLEAMSAGLPWLATDRGGIADIALDPNATRVIPATAEYAQVKKAVSALATDLRQGSISGQQQMALYARKFSASVLVQQWRDMLNLNTLTPQA